ncbi:hypothetical protein AGMMS49587_20240 [Spirochaetia bacterium]|nr:hypothetical protein AGMMS49587_20240 [Spirochaetia bacterium]
MRLVKNVPIEGLVMLLQMDHLTPFSFTLYIKENRYKETITDHHHHTIIYPHVGRGLLHRPNPETIPDHNNHL